MLCEITKIGFCRGPYTLKSRTAQASADQPTRHVRAKSSIRSAAAMTLSAGLLIRVASSRARATYSLVLVRHWCVIWGAPDIRAGKREVIQGVRKVLSQGFIRVGIAWLINSGRDKDLPLRSSRQHV
jgi:hypothetical protein